ncbi:MAG: EAL domain-containing protein [Ruthenibacterium sp.]
MKQKKHLFLKKWRAYALVLVTLSLLCVMVVFSCARYYVKLRETVAAESGSYLQEISTQIATNASKTISNNFTILDTVSSIFKSVSVSTFAQLDTIVKEQKEHWNFEQLLLVDAKGVAYDTRGHATALKSDAYLQDVIVKRQRSMSTSQLLDDTECVVFAIPVDHLVIDGTPMMALIATYQVSTFDRMLSMTAFNGTGYGHIIRRDGTVVIRSSSSYAPQTGYNILSSIAGAHFPGQVKSAAVLSDIASGRAGQTELVFNGVSLYMSYTPLETQEWCLLTFVPVEVANAKSILFFKITLLLCAFITLAFVLLIAVILYTAYRHQRKLEQLAFVDPITGGHTMQYFETNAAALLTASGAPQYALVYTNISKFKVLNEQLGRTACDAILRMLSDSMTQGICANECVGRLFGDNFCVLIVYENEAKFAQRLIAWNEIYTRAQHEIDTAAQHPFTLEMGVFVIDDVTLPLPDMIDRAKLALRETPRAAGALLHYTIYDEKVRHRLLREKHLEDCMEHALRTHEFEVYLQPKYRIDTETIGGAEALSRWKSPVDGMIYPDEFIPLFEKNGFIIKLDLWVLEQVCKTLRAWIDAGHTPLRISVNCSRIHLKTPNFLSQYRVILERYHISPSLIEIELTENVVFEDVVHLTRTIDEIHALGLHCSMDDFGSGYSSLNLIRDIPVDVLKLDKVFFRSGKTDLARTESVVGSIISMARALSMETVAEGVEERAQVEMLQRLGCDLIQGYYFAKPMPISDFETLAFQTAVD